MNEEEWNRLFFFNFVKILFTERSLFCKAHKEVLFFCFLTRLVIYIYIGYNMEITDRKYQTRFRDSVLKPVRYSCKNMHDVNVRALCQVFKFHLKYIRKSINKNQTYFIVVRFE